VGLWRFAGSEPLARLFAPVCRQAGRGSGLGPWRLPFSVPSQGLASDVAVMVWKVMSALRGTADLRRGGPARAAHCIGKIGAQTASRARPSTALVVMMRGILAAETAEAGGHDGVAFAGEEQLGGRFATHPINVGGLNTEGSRSVGGRLVNKRPRALAPRPVGPPFSRLADLPRSGQRIAQGIAYGLWIGEAGSSRATNPTRVSGVRPRRPDLKSLAPGWAAFWVEWPPDCRSGTRPPPRWGIHPGRV